MLVIWWYARVCEISDDVVGTRSVPATFGHWSIPAKRDVGEKKIRTHVANHVRKLSNSLGNCLPPRQSCNLQTVILDKSRAYTRGNHNFQFIRFLINCSFKNTKNINLCNIVCIFIVKCANNLYEMCKP